MKPRLYGLAALYGLSKVQCLNYDFLCVMALLLIPLIMIKIWL